MTYLEALEIKTDFTVAIVKTGIAELKKQRPQITGPAREDSGL